MLKLTLTRGQWLAVLSTLPYAKKAKERLAIEGVHFVWDGDWLLVQATDRYRAVRLRFRPAAAALTDGVATSETPFQLIVATSALRDINKHLTQAKHSGPVTLTLESETVTAAANGRWSQPNTATGTYPPLGVLFPNDPANHTEYQPAPTDFILDAALLTDMAKLRLPADTNDTIHNWVFRPYAKTEPNSAGLTCLLATRHDQDAQLEALYVTRLAPARTP